MRPSGRQADELRPLTFRRRYTRQAPGSVLVHMGRTTVLCTCCVDAKVPDFLVGSGKGWLSAEYGMLPGSTNTRKQRDRGGKVDGRSVEIQRLIGRSLRAVVDLTKLGENTLWLDCDVLEADGGTRCAAITGACVALAMALAKLARGGLILRWPLRETVAATSVGICAGQAVLDLAYEEDSEADVDCNVVGTASGLFVEIQGTAERRPFTEERLAQLLTLARTGLKELTSLQNEVLESQLADIDLQA